MGAMGTVTNVVIDQTIGKMSVILVAFDSEHIGTVKTKILFHEIKHRQHFLFIKKTSFQATRTQFPLTLAWAVTIQKWQELTLSEIVIDMTHAKASSNLEKHM